MLHLKTREDIQIPSQNNEKKRTRTEVTCRVGTPKDEEKNPSLRRRYEKKFNVIHGSKYKMKYYLLCIMTSV